MKLNWLFLLNDGEFSKPWCALWYSPLLTCHQICLLQAPWHSRSICLYWLLHLLPQKHSGSLCHNAPGMLQENDRSSSKSDKGHAVLFYVDLIFIEESIYLFKIITTVLKGKWN